jgi:hypothetical protein
VIKSAIAEQVLNEHTNFADLAICGLEKRFVNDGGDIFLGKEQFSF